jgi:hypothetical protein
MAGVKCGLSENYRVNKGSYFLKNSTKIWLMYAALGMVISIGIIVLMDRYLGLDFISKEAVVFAVMCSVMGAAVKKASPDESSN